MVKQCPDPNQAPPLDGDPHSPRVQAGGSSRTGDPGARSRCQRRHRGCHRHGGGH